VSFPSFNLAPPIYQALNLCGYENPTPVQSLSIPKILNHHDVVVSAQTGTGKTAAFVLPALDLLSKQPPCPGKKPLILILTPTRELATQITKSARNYGKYLRFSIANLVGGMPYGGQIKDLMRGADIIIATPGRLLDHIEQKRVDLSGISMLILDEADRMLDMGFIDEVKYIAKLTPQHRQTLLFSATIDNKLTKIISQLLKNPVRIDVSSEKIAPSKIKQEMYKTNNLQHKSRMLKHILNDAAIYKAIVFSATKINADKLAAQLQDDGFAAAPLHGDLRQNVRNRTIEQFRSGKIQFLVATDVAARGIDIQDITHVINYDLPKFCEDYVHRIGRTGRAGKAGTAISFVLPTDVRHLQRIEKYIGQRIHLIHSPEMGSGGSGGSGSDGKEWNQAEKNPRKNPRNDRSKNKNRNRNGNGNDKNKHEGSENKPFKFKGKKNNSKYAKSNHNNQENQGSKDNKGDKSYKSNKENQGNKSYRSNKENESNKSYRSNKENESNKSYKSSKSNINKNKYRKKTYMNDNSGNKKRG